MYTASCDHVPVIPLFRAHSIDPIFMKLDHHLEVHLGGVDEITAHGDPPPYVKDWMRSSLVRAGTGDTVFARTGSHIDAPASHGAHRADGPVVAAGRTVRSGPAGQTVRCPVRRRAAARARGR